MAGSQKFSQMFNFYYIAGDTAYKALTLPDFQSQIIDFKLIKT